MPILIQPLARVVGNERVKTPRCRAERSTRYFNDKFTQPRLPEEERYRCAHGAAFVVNNRELCVRHASILVLKLALEQQGYDASGISA